jgi:tryptophanyl-tRNA synthetase
MPENKVEPKIDFITGIRPTGTLTVANYIGAVRPIIELQGQGKKMMIFVADMHAATTHEPSEVQSNIRELVKDYIALGLNPKEVTIFVQSDIKDELSTLTLYLSRLITVSELLRVPTLKDKIKPGETEETASALLLLYPVLMAADIILPRAAKVPVGEDQLAHIEVVRKLARRFNVRYGHVFVEPHAYTLEAARILSLKGETKMGKSYPEGAIFLTEDLESVRAKIKRAETADAGEKTASVESHFELAKGLSETTEQRKEFKTLKKRHYAGEQVMAEFKQKLEVVTIKFLSDFQTAREKITDEEIDEILAIGSERIKKIAAETMAEVEEALFNPTNSTTSDPEEESA